MDFVMDAFANGRRLKILTTVNDLIKESRSTSSPALSATSRLRATRRMAAPDPTLGAACIAFTGDADAGFMSSGKDDTAPLVGGKRAQLCLHPALYVGMRKQWLGKTEPQALKVRSDLIFNAAG